MNEISIGAQRFDAIRENHYFYIDKTSFIKEWWESGDEVTLIARPRRFGKTLNMRMLECFFSSQYADRSDLFDGLSIWNDPSYQRLQGTYPVIFLSFADIKERSYAQARKAIISTINDLFQSYKDLWKDDSENEKQRYRFMTMHENVSDADAAKALQRLSAYLQYRCGKKVLILLDEYDTPLQEAFVHGYWDEMSVFIRSLFNSTFKTNPAMERAIMTGTTRISRESIFSDLNNLNVVTTTSTQYETSFGFTENEVFHALDEFGLDGQAASVKEWYDGFTFGNTADIYNPWSILNFLKKREFAPYWANTSSNGLISYELRVADNSIKHQMETLMNGGTVESVIDEQIIFSQLDRDPEAIWSLFLAGGYLKIVNRTFDGSFYHYRMTLTNKEVRIMFHSLILDWFKPAGTSYSEFTKALVQEDLDALNYYLNDILLNVASSFDTRKKVMPGHEPESFYHGLVLGLVVTEPDYVVTSNRESGIGRYDVLMKPKIFIDKQPALISSSKSGFAKSSSHPAIIIEFKVFDPRKEATLDETADRALQQIEEKKYDTDLIHDGFAKDSIIHYGMAFHGKEALVKED